MSAIPEESIDWVERFHSAVDEAARSVATVNAPRLACRHGCADCCTDGLSVFSIEAAVIERHHGELLRAGTPHVAGGCAFLDGDRGCRIYAQRPYVCRTQGLPLRWLEEDDEDDDALIENRDICPKNIDGGPPLEELPADACWTLGIFEARLAERQAAVDGGQGTRVPLRALFAASGDRRRLPVVG
jgi:uncharacterized protein